jgi:hypothetical protein
MDEEAIVRAEADDVWVEATAPVRARTTTKARTMVFMVLLLWEDRAKYFEDCAGLCC